MKTLTKRHPQPWEHSMNRVFLIPLLLTLLACDPPRDSASTKTPDKSNPATEETAEKPATTPDEAKEAAPAASPQGRWLLVTLNGKAPIEGTHLTLAFDGDNVSGHAGCNNFGGTVSFTDDTLSFGDLFITEMACVDLLEQEGAYFSAVKKATSWARDGDTLELVGEGVELLYTAQKTEAVADLPLVGTTWSANTFLLGEVASSLIAGSEITLVLKDGEATGRVTCNHMNGTYTLSGDDQLSIKPGSITELACDAALLDQEGQYVELLGTIATYKLEGDTLTLRSADGKNGVIFNA
ncbi:MAG: hypothetical protein COW42_03080, partial [Deltaproteobacteria bacterium CG17_big_fil_post_rev_8_21_14_2_50_63_7]